MTNYEQDTLNLINGKTPKEKYETLKNIMNLLDNVATPARGTEAENWTIYDVAKKINEQKLLIESK